MFLRAKLPARAVELWGKAVKGKDWREAKDAMHGACNAGGIVLLTGPRWTGKTFMVTSIAIDFLAGAKTAIYSRGIDLLKDLRMDFNQNNTESRAIVRPYREFTLLVVDEVGLRVKGDHGYSESDASLFTDLIDLRYSNKLATILVSNESPEKTYAILGPSIARRIEEVGTDIVASWPAFNV